MTDYTVVRQENQYGGVRYKVKAPSGGFVWFTPVMSTELRKDKVWRTRFFAERFASRRRYAAAWRTT